MDARSLRCTSEIVTRVEKLSFTSWAAVKIRSLDTYNNNKGPLFVLLKYNNEAKSSLCYSTQPPEINKKKHKWKKNNRKITPNNQQKKTPTDAPMKTILIITDTSTSVLSAAPSNHSRNKCGKNKENCYIHLPHYT